jgi:anthranilate/para-aminobenzoate synthase component I
MSFEEYRRGFDIVHCHLHGGNSFLVNYTCATPVDTDLTLRQVFDHARAPYRLWVNDSFVVFSPEIFVRITDGFIYSHPMKGTMDATLPDARERLLADPKEIAEHVMLMDLGRNDVGRVADIGSVKITENMIIERYSHVMHIVSSVEGRLREGMSNLDVLRATFPAGTLSGAAKVRAMEIIDELEPSKRGIYGGAVGYLGFKWNSTHPGCPDPRNRKHRQSVCCGNDMAVCL